MTVINFRCDEQTLRVLDQLGEPGETRSDTLRRAIRDADVLRLREQMRREALRSAGPRQAGDADQRGADNQKQTSSQ